MVARLEIMLRQGLKDAEGENIRRKAKDYLGIETQSIRVIRVLTLDSNLSPKHLDLIRAQIFTNPVTEQSSFSPMAADFDWVIWVGLRPGVRDTAGSTAVEAIEDFLKVKFASGEAVYTSKVYALRGSLSRAQVESIAREILANDIIQQWRVYSREGWDQRQGIGYILPKVILNHEPRVGFIAIGSDEELKRLSIERNLALQERDIPVIR